MSMSGRSPESRRGGEGGLREIVGEKEEEEEEHDSIKRIGSGM